MTSKIDNLLTKLHLSEIQASRAWPVNIKSEDEFLFHQEICKTINPISPIYFKSGVITPIGLLHRFLFIDSSQFGRDTSKKKLIKEFARSLASLFSVRKIRRANCLIFITNPYATNFFHWFLDVLSKIQYIESVKKTSNTLDWKCLIPANCDAEFVRQSLSIFEVEYIHVEKNELLFVDDLILVPDLAPTGNYRKPIILELQKKFRNSFKKFQSNKFKHKVYVTRRNAIKRKIINEDDLLPILIEYGFSIVDFDLMSFEEQVECMFSAEILVSLHGAGLTHMLWMKPESKVLEVRARGDSHNNCYFSLASDLNHQYYYVLADKLDDRLITQEADFFLEKDHFKKVLLEVISIEN